MMQRSAENNKCMAHIIPVTSKSTVSISPLSVSAYQSAVTQLLPNDVARVVIIYWRDLSPRGGQGDLQYLRCNCYGGGDMSLSAAAVAVTCQGLDPFSNLITQRA